MVTKEAKLSLGVASSSRLSLMMRCTTLGGMEDLGNLQGNMYKASQPLESLGRFEHGRRHHQQHP